MTIVICVLGGVAAGMAAAGARAVSLARRDEVSAASRWASIGCWIAAATAAALAFALLGLPFREITIVEKGRVEKEEVEVSKWVWKWYVWPMKVTRREEIDRPLPPVKKIIHRFSIARLILLGALAGIAYVSEGGAIRAAWWCFG